MTLNYIHRPEDKANALKHVRQLQELGTVGCDEVYIRTGLEVGDMRVGERQLAWRNLAICLWCLRAASPPK